jgi:hypothetical protein
MTKITMKFSVIFAHLLTIQYSAPAGKKTWSNRGSGWRRLWLEGDEANSGINTLSGLH